MKGQIISDIYKKTNIIQFLDNVDVIGYFFPVYFQFLQESVTLLSSSKNDNVNICWVYKIRTAQYLNLELLCLRYYFHHFCHRNYQGYYPYIIISLEITELNPAPTTTPLSVCHCTEEVVLVGFTFYVQRWSKKVV